MAAAKPQQAISDSLEVTRMHHLLTPGIQPQSDSTKKALTASSVILAEKAARKRERQAKYLANKKQAVGFEGGADLGEGEDDEMDSEVESEEEEEEVSMADALREADLDLDDLMEEEAPKTKVKVKATKKKSALKKAGGGMGMSLDA
jgi:hypothetical protein